MNSISGFGSPPRPEVQFLPTLFRRVQAGDIRIPEFQRGLVWTHEQIRSLLESVYRSFPIGSLLMWNAETELFKPFRPEGVSMPAPEELPSGEASYVLDGMQRLITLYASFNGGGGEGGRFDILFDLTTEQFVHEAALRGNVPPTCLKLSRVFVPRQFLEDQAILAKLEDSERWLTRSVALHSRFQEYALPIIMIEEAKPAEAVEIFTNINRAGSSLSTIDFMRALTWHDNFDLNQAVAAIQDNLPELFRPSDETVAKTVALMLDIDPLPDTILQLRTVDVASLNRAVGQSIDAINKVAAFLRETMGIASAEFVPYEGQLFVLIAVCSSPYWNADASSLLQKWFIASSFSESLQGRPDHAIVKLVRDAVASLTAGRFDLDSEVTIQPGELARRLLRKGTAVSSGFLALLSQVGARSIFSGAEIARSEYLEAFDASKLAPIAAQAETRGRTSIKRQLMNLVLVTSSEAYAVKGHGEVRAQLRNCAPETLRSQFLDHAALDILDRDGYETFGLYRAELVRQQVMEFAARQ